jgi:hypothetical protein
VKLNPQSPGRALRLLQRGFVGRVGRIPENGHSGNLRDGLLEQRQRLRLADVSSHSRDIAARSSKACDEPGLNEISGRRYDDRKCRGRLFGSLRGGDTSLRIDDVDLEADELGDNLANSLDSSPGPPDLDHDVLSVDPAEFAQARDDKPEGSH